MSYYGVILDTMHPSSTWYLARSDRTKISRMSRHHKSDYEHWMPKLQDITLSFYYQWSNFLLAIVHKLQDAFAWMLKLLFVPIIASYINSLLAIPSEKKRETCQFHLLCRMTLSIFWRFPLKEDHQIVKDSWDLQMIAN